VEQLCKKENERRETLEERVKALSECVELERRQAVKAEEAHKLVSQNLTTLDTLLRREMLRRHKFENKLGHSIDLLKRNALRTLKAQAATGGVGWSQLF